MSNFFNWFFPVLCGLLAGLWLWSLLRQGRGFRAVPTAANERGYRRAEAEDALKAAHGLQTQGGTWKAEELSRSLGLPTAMAEKMAHCLLAFGWAKGDPRGDMHLTETGERRARELIRAHRLWERYLVDRKGIALEAVHAEADRHEHEMTIEELERLDADLAYPPWDPHGHSIPAPGSGLPPSAAHLLSEEGTPGSRLRVFSLDDEPAALLAQLVALGLRPGVDLVVQERGPQLLHVRLNGKDIPLAVAAARHVSVIPAPVLPVPLGELPVNSRVRIAEISGSGKHQRRILDMGFVPGAEVTVIRTAPLGDPVEYRIKGTAVSLRRKEADSVLVEEARDE